MEERLNKWLSRMGVCSRREADRLIQEGKVLIDGKVAQMGQRVEDGQKVICDGKPVGDTDGGRGEVKPPRPVLLAVNKPRGIVCTTSDKTGQKILWKCFLIRSVFTRLAVWIKSLRD